MHSIPRSPAGKAAGAYSKDTFGVLQGILESSDDMFAAVDAELCLVAFNAAFVHGFSGPAGTAPRLAQKLDELLAASTLAAGPVIGLVHRALAGEAIRQALDLAGPGEREKHFDASLKPVRDPADNAVVVAVVLRDITAQKAAERMLREQSEELRLALRVGSAGSFQWDARTHEHRWSNEILALYGLAPGICSRRDEDWLDCLLPEDRATALAAVERSLKTGQYAAEFRIRRRNDGQIRWLRARGQVFFDRQGVPSRMVGINVDVTEQRQVQSELEESKARLEAVLDSLAEGVSIIDLQKQVLHPNPAARRILCNRSPDDESRCLAELTDSFDVFALDGRRLAFDEWPVGKLLRGESFTDYEVRLEDKCSGKSWILSNNGATVRNARGERILGVLTSMDVSERKRAEEALKESERRLALALKSSRSAVWEADVASQTIVAADDLLFTMLDYAPRELRTLADWVQRIHDDDRERIITMLDEVIHGVRDGYYGVEVRYCAKDGSSRWILCQAVAADRDLHGTATRLVGTHTDITDRKRADERAREAALHDPLTGLPNRALVFEYGRHLLAAAERSHGRGAMLFVDLDRFKPINDVHGHEVGDLVLQEVARRLLGCTRDEDLVGRLGGDEFVILLAHLDSARHRATTVAQHVVEHISKPYQINGLDLSLSASIGVSCYPEHAADLGKLIHAADLAMYQAKQSGRGACHVYTPELERRADAALSLEARLKNALKRGQLALHYQPVMDLNSGRLSGAEALLRLVDESDEPSGPAAFIPIAESVGLIGELGEWVAAEACRQIEAWHREGMRIPVAINVSALQFRQQAFAERLGRIIADSRIDPTALQLEVTESTLMESVDEAVDILNRIKALGVSVALDDFGTGYSSLSSLSTLPLDKLKVDQSFVKRIGRDKGCRAVTEAIIALGRTLELEVVAEGIESVEAVRYLRDHGCTLAQGYWFSRPLPAPEFVRWYRQYAVH
ncbi:MAG TPA: EAL domain-containing protein [Azonexus sp.]